MPEAFLLDTSAFLTLTDREPGVDRVRELLKAAKRGDVRLHACFVTLAETQYILTYDLGSDRARRLVAAIKKFPIQWLHSDDALCASAAEIKAAHKVSLADAFIAATAQRHQVEGQFRRQHHHDRRQHRHGNDHDGRQHAAPVLQEQVENYHGEEQAQDDGLPHAAHRVAHLPRPCSKPAPSTC